MDRNTASAILLCLTPTVALRKESVDRNNRMLDKTILQVMSLSARRAWIEIRDPARGSSDTMSLSARRAWIEINLNWQCGSTNTSLSARRAWIEIMTTTSNLPSLRVALRKESVDRNIYVVGGRGTGKTVALRKESVDRNLKDSAPALLPAASLSARRAWIEISALYWFSIADRSLSARRAWIEILAWAAQGRGRAVALRKESVDRNIFSQRSNE